MNITSIKKIFQGVVGLMLIVSQSLGNEIPDAITIWGEIVSTNVTCLMINRRELSDLPTEIGKFTSLTRLNLDHNQLSTLPTEIGNLTSLRELYLSTNKLKTIPTEIGKLTLLKYLYLSVNKLHTIPLVIIKLTSLTELYLSSNRLKTIPTEMGKLTSLMRLNLYDNQLSTLPCTICHLTNLTTLALNNNPLSGGEQQWAMILIGTEVEQCLAFYRQKDNVIAQNVIAKYILLLSGNRQEDGTTIWSLMPEEIIVYISTILYQLRY